MSDLILQNFRGCGSCDLVNEGCNCNNMITSVRIAFKKSQMADNWGRFVTVFSKGEEVIGTAIIKNNKVYCVSARSNIYEDYEDFISLEDIEVETM